MVIVGKRTTLNFTKVIESNSAVTVINMKHKVANIFTATRLGTARRSDPADAFRRATTSFPDRYGRLVINALRKYGKDNGPFSPYGKIPDLYCNNLRMAYT